MSQANVIIGEASESDSEEEINTSTLKKDVKSGTFNLVRNPQGVVIAGEAPESDDEHEDVSVASVSSAASVSSVPYLTSESKITQHVKKEDKIKYSSLLHKKLYECNISLHKNLADLVHNTIVNRGHELNVINQQLLKSQVILQEAATSLNIVQNHMLQLHAKLVSVTSTSFLPNIRICENDIPESVGKEESRLV